MRRPPKLLATLLMFSLSAVVQAEEPVTPAEARARERAAIPAEPPAPTAAQESATQPQPPLRVDPSLLKKKIVVYTRDGSVYEGKLIEVTDDTLHLKRNGTVKSIPLVEVAVIERRRSRAALFVGIAGAVTGTLALLWLLGASSD